MREWVRLFAARFTYPLCATLMMELWMVLCDQVIFMLAMYVTHNEYGRNKQFVHT